MDPRPEAGRSPTPGLLALAALFVGAGVLHFLRPKPFDRIVPPWVPMPARTATLVSGAAEIAGGLGLLHPATRPGARLGLLALLVAVFPANVGMAWNAERFRPLPEWALWARLPLQPLLMWLVWRAGRPSYPTRRSSSAARKTSGSSVGRRVSRLT
ncbi:DoxX family protein [Deinococcus planocerae]|uniref:DoxX family protein n=1 Tax=Deinococcus planocerae TaxID=1737569 RepID=UPI0015E13EA5|nr:DoxX family protein [Deinococcus planocerae]